MISGILAQLFGSLGSDKTSSVQVFLKSFDWIREFGKEIFPFQHFFFIAVGLRGVRSRVITNSVRDCFDQTGSFLFNDDLACFLSCSVDGKDVGAINSD